MTIDATNLRAADLGIDGDDEPVLDVLDLPQLYTKPPASALLTVLEDLSYEPPSWETTPHSRSPRSRSGTSSPVNKPKNGGPLLRKKPKVRSEGLPRYLTRIIASPLAWIADEDEKEKVWEAAAKRLSERSGRTGMGALWRRLGIPLKKAAAAKPVGTEMKAGEDGGVIEVGHVVTDTIPVTNSTAQDGSHTGRSEGEDTEEGDEDDEALSIHLHEPALTADNLGLKTWASSYLLAKRLVLLRSDNDESDTTITNPQSPPLLPTLPPDAEILELGSGTGLVGMAAARILRRKVWLTDLEGIVGNLERNVRGNWKVVAGLSRDSGSDGKEVVEGDESEVEQMMRRERMETAVLDWSDPLNVVLPGRSKQSQLEGEEEVSTLPSPSANPTETTANGSYDSHEHENQVDGTPLTDSTPQSTTWNPNTFPLILAADPIYSPDHPTLLTTAIGAHLTLHSALSRVLVEMPIREGFASEREDFRTRMQGLGLRVLGEGEEVGYDDWGSGGEDGRSFTEVRCWWSVWGWGERQMSW
ncbi:hypothetical protein KC338_g4709 [Hortaea werneckii]|uniref:Uncharacterized protein n=1 Tax=Hortaea werneckii TaxID=91943 RepID=A0A3M7GWS8_HORWE|nr:hypothetical protein KC323_g5372 [Hortaea werneckii]KAI6866426.1 hypothetical protein KC338_g4709 [Hortaea werneckii]KAI7349032.1 hypothetical protein KC320_g6287 [Hortaea werneckii]RMZ05479.1 hypothetical protein D0862_04954 [Hortaea werneckii]